MLNRPEIPAIDFVSMGLVSADSYDMQPIDSGLNSHVWKAGQRVIKITQAQLNLDQAKGLCSIMQYEHAVLEDHIGEYIPDTTYAAVEREDGAGAHVVTVQPFIEGDRLLDFWRSGKDLRPLGVFLDRCVKIYEDEGLVPDVAIPRTGFNVVRSRNILIDREGQPVLVDSAFGKIQRSHQFATSWAWCVHKGILVARSRLQRKSANA